MSAIYSEQRKMIKEKFKKVIRDTKEKTIKEIIAKQNRDKELREYAVNTMNASKKILEERVLPKEIFIRLIELLKILETALNDNNLETVQSQTDILTSLNNEVDTMYQERKKTINGSECLGIYEAYKLLTENPVMLNRLNEKGQFFEILHIFSSSKKGHAVSCMYKLIRDGEILDHPYCIELLRVVRLTNSVLSSDCLTSLVKRHSLGKKDIRVAEMIVSYSSLSKLVSAHEKMFGRQNGFLEEGSKADISLKTFEHFQNYPDDGTVLFGCVDLFQEDTDPTIERQIGKLYGKVLSMPHSKQVLALKKVELSLSDI